MYSVAFIYEPGEYDIEFHRLNQTIDEVARSMPDFLGAESWQSASGKRRNATYFWGSLEALKAFSVHPAHQEAKRKYSRWYEGYHVVISEVVRSYGDSAFGHATPNERRRLA
jgi:heme-degrading monooxygenase HmoA